MTWKYRAAATFQGKLGFIQRGQPLNPDPGYARELLRSGLIVPFEQWPPANAPAPVKRGVIPQAPRRAATFPTSNEDVKKDISPKDSPGRGQPAKVTEVPAAVGGALTSASLRPARASTKRTAKKSARGGKASVPRRNAASSSSTQAGD